VDPPASPSARGKAVHVTKYILYGRFCVGDFVWATFGGRLLVGDVWWATFGAHPINSDLRLKLQYK